jgi:Tfp pilus assembly protein PilF
MSLSCSFLFRTWVLVGVAVCSQVSAAQRGATGNNNNSSRPSTAPRNPAAPDIATTTMFISGKVLLESGGPLPEAVAIERICNGVTRREGYTDLKGQFNIQLGANITFQDASETDSRQAPNTTLPQGTTVQGRRTIDLTGCELRAVLAGYQSTVVILRNNGGEPWQPYDINTIFLKRIGNASGTTISVTSMAAPRDAMRAYEKAQKARQEKPSEAEKELNKAVEIYPQFAAAWAVLGDIHRQHGQFDRARSEYARALAADPQFVTPSYGLAVIAMQERKWEEAVRLTDQILKMNALAFPLTYFFNAAANYNLQNFDAAEENARKYKTLDPQHSHPDVCILLSYLLTRKRDYAGAAREIREFLAAAPNWPQVEELRIEAKRLEDLSVSAKRD